MINKTTTNTKTITTLCLLFFSFSIIFGNEIITLNGTLSTVTGGSVSKDRSYMIFYEFPSFENDSALKVWVTIDEHSESTKPVMFIVRQEESVISWELPLISPSKTLYFERNQTLFRNSFRNSESNRCIVIEIASAFNASVPFRVLLVQQRPFDLELNQNYKISASPFSPLFYQFRFPDSVKMVLLKVTSFDVLCATIGIRNKTEDSSSEVESLWQTMDKFSGLTLEKEKYPLGVFIHISVKDSDETCASFSKGGIYFSVSGKKRVKNLNLLFVSEISKDEYLIATGSALAFCVLTYVLLSLLSCLSLKIRPNHSSLSNNREIEDLQGEEVRGVSNSSLTSLTTSISEEEDAVEDEINLQFPINSEILYVSSLSKKTKGSLSRKSTVFFWNLLTIALFYGLPVVQLMLTYQQVVNSTGNQDLCYFNYLCSHPLGVLSDFNHVYSNIGYIFFGLLFLLSTFRKEMNSRKDKETLGIPSHFGFYYAMGVALVMEGLLSASYHVCPNHSNFQFDTAFMYTMSLLILLKIYESRHPDINVSAYTAFGFLALIILIGVIGVLMESLVFWSLFVTFHIFSCLCLGAQVYYNKTMSLISLARVLTSGLQRPTHCDRLILLVTAFVVNVTLDGLGIAFIAPKNGDFASFLLSLLIINVLMYTTYYIILKIRVGERIVTSTRVYILFSLISWFASMYLFCIKSTSWNSSPAHSRLYNRDCSLLGFYDTHDIWHLMSALSLFLSFMILLSLDDDLTFVPRNQIQVF